MVGSETLYYQWISRIKKDVLERPSLIIVAPRPGLEPGTNGLTVFHSNI